MAKIQEELYVIKLSKLIRNDEDDVAAIADNDFEGNLQAILQDPSLNTLQVAEQYSLFFNQIEEQGIAKYLKKNGGETQQSQTKSAPAVPKRLSGTSGATNDQSRYSGGVAKPNNLKTAHNAVLDFLKKNPIGS